ncbi:hypothetical protein [Halobellus sp. H-GB7]|uniref:hypothetical protein n=1 Tax=Halobellus sp. H-GB7 TaxID=3069756 RepID=UPI0027B0F7FE|nr:hypothetical protein [Halobellus sp. H-GB7]MDQ2053220.1 hypothetical protein [Halobellus sp. H-GB7]
MPNAVPAPAVDPLDVDDSADVDPRPRADLVAEVMAMRSCAMPEAERYLDERGPVQVERELQARWA